MNCPERGCPFRFTPCPDHDAEHMALFRLKVRTWHQHTWPVVGPGYDRRNPDARLPRRAFLVSAHRTT